MSLMDPRIHQVLDGELPREALPPGLRPALDRLQAAAALLRLGPTGRSVAARVMAEIRRPFPGLLTRLVRWVTERHAITVSLRPVWSLAVAAVVVVVVVVALIPSRGSEGPTLSAEEGVAQFVGRFPGARSVEVVGSFTDWRPGVIPLQDDDHDGVWQAEVVLPAGEHEYMFVVDGERWVPDPLADRYVDDGFGGQNAVIIVQPGNR
ncbi:MAG TPA: isoamylase early set domain-containing protein [Gemmatimonadales bacterium]|nr:isoamylase early set domain-containing protein [Gemmatimonadales bacterium]